MLESGRNTAQQCITKALSWIKHLHADSPKKQWFYFFSSALILINTPRAYPLIDNMLYFLLMSPPIIIPIKYLSTCYMQYTHNNYGNMSVFQYWQKNVFACIIDMIAILAMIALFLQNISHQTFGYTMFMIVYNNRFTNLMLTINLIFYFTSIETTILTHKSFNKCMLIMNTATLLFALYPSTTILFPINVLMVSTVHLMTVNYKTDNTPIKIMLWIAAILIFISTTGIIIAEQNINISLLNSISDPTLFTVAIFALAEQSDTSQYARKQMINYIFLNHLQYSVTILFKACIQGMIKPNFMIHTKSIQTTLTCINSARKIFGHSIIIQQSWKHLKHRNQNIDLPNFQRS